MPIADFETYCAILDRALDGGFALPTVNVTSLEIFRQLHYSNRVEHQSDIDFRASS
jgi:hypothetical protein